tara:strand:+ start:9914 stop:11320 length:1407 start_codon:yes stop_codon:yes gene_type:complete
MVKKIIITERQLQILGEQTLLNESGIRNIKELSKRYQKAEIYFHQDLDGVVSAIGMRDYLSRYGIETIDCHVIQYGDKEFAVKKPDASGDTMPVLVDFAHGKPEFTIHTDHHDSQAGVEDHTSTDFSSARSNVQTISQTISPSELFTDEDIQIINTVDSADYAKHDISPSEVMNYVKGIDNTKTTKGNKWILGLLTNKLLLAYKNKKEFLEELVMKATPSLMNIYQNIIRIAGEKGFATAEEMLQNQINYVGVQKDSEKVRYEDGIIVQYGGGYMMKPGSYDRYTPFKNHPDADFLVIAWPMGLVQASCNPFKESRELKGINLGDLAQEVLKKHQSMLMSTKVTVDRIKFMSEMKTTEFSSGFGLSDLTAFYGDKVKGINLKSNNGYVELFKNVVDKKHSNLSYKQRKVLGSAWVSAWDIMQANSGGHKCITNISGLMYLKKELKKEMIVGLQNDIVEELKKLIKTGE